MNIDTLVESFYSNKDETESIINEVMKLLLTEAKARNITLSWDGIPDIPISEIPWSSVETVEGEGADIQGPERQQLMQFLDNIEGDDLQDKVKGLAAFYDADPSVLLDKTQDMTAKEKISAALGYLTFFKTLTKIIAHFNASSAGFSFESFLGVLLGGTQIPTSGADTIADLVDQDGVPISLKLYTEGQLKVGGSFTDLANDLRKYGQMQYVAVTKTLNDEKTSGTLDFYRFNFTLDNIANILVNAGLHNPEVIQLPAGFVTNPGGFEDIEIPPPPKVDELKELFMQALAVTARQAGVEEALARRALEATGLLEDNPEYLSGAKVFGHPKSRLKTTGVTVSFGKAMGLLPDDYDPKPPPGRTPERAEWNRLTAEAKELAQSVYGAVLIPAYAKVTESATRTVRARQELINRAGGEYLSPEESAAAYNELSEGLKKKALLLSHGYVNTDQFDLTQPRVMTVDQLADPYPVFPEGQTQVRLGAIEVGQEKVVGLMQKVSQIIDTSVFLIFEDLKVLTTNIQAYFGNGLQDDTQAQTAIEASDSIGERTKELKGA